MIDRALGIARRAVDELLGFVDVLLREPLPTPPRASECACVRCQQPARITYYRTAQRRRCPSCGARR